MLKAIQVPDKQVAMTILSNRMKVLMKTRVRAIQYLKEGHLEDSKA